ncbi:DUF642 domain-containing protein [Candidatus Kaiserbacteria bacterium]|nr:DUF642 domain-containing protein [Candidatus Kaiserbacteria bacterium]
MNIFIVNKLWRARTLALVTIFSLVLSAFPASFFVAQAAVGENISVTVVPDSNPEYFSLTYTGSHFWDLDGWTVEDAAANVFNLDDTTLNSGDTWKVCQNSGDTSGCDQIAGGSSVWNNDGDTFILKDPNGEEIFTFDFGDVDEKTDSIELVPFYASKDKVAICHATASDENPYNYIEPNIKAFLNSGHDEDKDDIIPPFYYEDGEGITYFAGSNWEGDNIALYRDKCGDEDAVYGTITVTKVVEGGEAKASDFTLYIDEEEVTSGDSNQLEADDKSGVKYYISEGEDGPAGYYLDSIECKKGDDVVGKITEDGYEVKLKDGWDIECTVVNVFDGDDNPNEPIYCDYGFGPKNLLKNGSFEEPIADENSHKGGFWEHFASVPNWVIKKVSDETLFTLEIWNNMFNGASDGEQNVELDGDGESTMVSQTVATIPGATYELRFDFAAREKTSADDNDVDVMIDGAFLMNASGDETDWETYSKQFKADDGSTTVTLKDVGTSNGKGSLVDNAVLCLVEEPKTFEVVAHKIVCKDEEDVPNKSDWAGLDPLDANSAQDWVDNHDSCKLVPDWQFEWVTDSKKHDAGDSHIGVAGGNWNTFGPTDNNGKTSVTINLEDLGKDSRIWLREVLKEGYIPFTHEADPANNNDYSAAFFCNDDVLNYDNYEWINNVEDDETYYCVAWNVPKTKAYQCEMGLLYMDDETNAPEISSLHLVDEVTGATTLFADYKTHFHSVVAVDKNGVVYSIERGSGNLITLDNDGGDYTVVGPTGLDAKKPVAMEFAPNGTLYLLTQKSDELYEINPNTGFATLLHALDLDVNGGDVVFEGGLIVYIKNTGTIYGIDAGTYAESNLGSLSVSPVTSAATKNGTHYAYTRSDDFVSFTLNPFVEVNVVNQTGPFGFGDGSFCPASYDDSYVIEGNKWNDLDGDGYWDDNEDGIYDWGIALRPMSMKAVEELHVSAESNAVVSTVNPLQLGNIYIVEVSGTYSFGNREDYEADAEWSHRADAYTDNPLAAHGWTVGELTYNSVVGLDLQIDGQNINWGSFNNDHLYKTVVEGDGSALDFSIYDSNYSDNTGGLDVAIYDVTSYVTQTNSDGKYSFNVPAGDYQIVEIMQEGWTQTYPAEPSYYHVTVPDDLDGDYNFGNQKDYVDPECIIEGHKFNEYGEPLEGWTIGLAVRDSFLSRVQTFISDGPVYGEPEIIGTDVTDDDGYYCIEPREKKFELQDIIPKLTTYGVYEEMQSGWEFMKVEVDEDERDLQPDSFFDVFVEVDLDEDSHVDFYNREKDDELVCEPRVNLIANGGFEKPEVTNDAGWDIFDLFNHPAMAWTVKWLNIQPQTPDDAYLELHAGVNDWSPYEGEQYAELDSDWQGPGFNGNENASVMISQTIDTIPGEEYTLSWAFSPRPGKAFSENKLEVFVDGNEEVTNQESGIGLSDTNWTTDSYSFTATDNTTEIAFQDAGDGNSVGTFLDNVSLVCNPETEVELYKVEGYVWNDDDRDGNWGEEDILDGWKVNITNGDDSYSTTSDKFGYYYFLVPAGTWTITEEVEDEWEQTFPNDGSHVVTVPNDVTLLDSVINFIIPTAYAEDDDYDTYGDYNFGNDYVGITTFRSGGGGSTNAPSCRLFDAEQDGPDVKLIWETVRGSELSITANGTEIFSTSEDSTVDDGNFDTTISEDTVFELTVTKGVKSDSCEEEVLYGGGGTGPGGEVAGAQTSRIPTGAPDAGAGGGSADTTSTIWLLVLLSLAIILSSRFTKST